MTSNLLTIARLELVGAARLRWIRLLTMAFAVLAMAAAYSAGAASDAGWPDGFPRTTMALVPVVLLLVPLAALVLGIAGQSSEAGSEAFLFAQPIGRGTVLVGRWLGECAALAGSIAAGLSCGAAFISSVAGAAGIGGFMFFIATTIVLAVVFLSVAAVVAAATENRVAALAVGTFVWFFFVLLYDGVALSLAGWLTGTIGGRVLFGSVFGNPTDLARILTLSVAGTPNILGAAGDAWSRFLGGNAAAAAASSGALGIWAVAPLVAAARVLRTRDL